MKPETKQESWPTASPTPSASAPWEQAATLRLRDGDATVLNEYDQDARITGGDPEQMMDAAATRYVTLTAGHGHAAHGDQRYRDLLTAALPPGCEHEPGHRDKWLCKNGRRRGPATHSARPAPAPGTPTSQRSTQAHGANPASLATLQPK